MECLVETHFSQSLVRMAVLSPVFQHVPNHIFSFVAVVRDATTGSSLAGIVITWETGTARHLGSFFVASTTGFAPLTSRERLQPRRTIRGIITRGVVSLLATEQPFAFVHISHRWHYFCALTSIFAGMFGGVRLRAPAGSSTRVSNTKRTKSWTYDLPGLDNRKYCCFNARRGTSFDESGKTRHLQIRPELPSELNVVCSVGHSDSYPYEMASFHSESQMQSGQNWESVTWPS